MKQCITIAFLIIANALSAQTVETLAKGQPQAENKDDYFAFLEDKTDTAQLTYVATFRTTTENKRHSITDLFLKTEKEARALGANGFRLHSFSRDYENKPVLVLDTYVVSDTLMKQNFTYHEKNVVFIFCGDKVSDEKYTVKVNKDKTEFPSGTYLKYKLREGNELRVNKGGFTGTTVTLVYGEDKPATFLTVAGFAPTGPAPMAGTVGMTFTTGQINKVDGDLGHLLVQILKQSESIDPSKK